MKMSFNRFAALVVTSFAPLASAAGLSSNSAVGSSLISKARRLENANDMDYSYVAKYSIKFQGCHHISQWNEDADEDNEVRIETKRLVRFRLCPSDACSEESSAGCSKNYGSYIVDMSTFVYEFLYAQSGYQEYNCDQYEQTCLDECGDDDNACLYQCYYNLDMLYCYEGDDDAKVEEIDMLDYAQCAQYVPQNGDDDQNDGDDQAEQEYYIGPYCGDQGGEIKFGLFTDNTCTTFSSGGTSLFEDMSGYELPYSSDSVATNACVSCGEDDDDEENYNDYYDNDDVKEVCQNIYQVSGKCESYMGLEYPNEAACTYIEGVKIIREDGIIRTTSVKKSKGAAIGIGLFTTVAVLLGAYVYYLRTKLGRAKINLSAS